MTYLYRALRNNPIGIWPFDTGFSDESGYDKDGTATGTISVTRPIVAGGIQAYQFDGTDKLSLPIDRLLKDNIPFSLEIWFKPDVIAGEAALLARNNSGLFASGTDIFFRLDLATDQTVRFERVEAGNIYHVVGVYDGNDAYLYVNNTYLESASIPAGSVFADSAAGLRIEASGGYIFTVDAPAVYNYALRGSAVKANFEMGTNYGSISNIVQANGGNIYRFWDGAANLKERYDVDLTTGGFTGSAAVINGELVNQWNETAQQYTEGYWYYSHYFEPEDDELDGGRLSWDANNANLEVAVSLDKGASFTPASNGADILGAQTLNAGLEVIVRIHLPASVEKTTIYSVSLCFYTSKDVFGSNEDLPAAVLDPENATLSEFDHAPNAFNNTAGIEFTGTESGILVPPDGDYGHYRAFEMVAYLPALPTSGTVLQFDGGGTITANGSGQWVASGLTALYLNGQAANIASPITMEAHKPYHIIVVFPDTAGGFYIGNNSARTAGYPMRLSFLATYYNVISAADVASIYGAWVGAPAVVVTETDIADVSEHIYADTGLPFLGYTYVWSITGAG